MPVTKIASPTFELFLFMIFVAKPITVTVNDVVLEYVVSPPLSNNLYFFNSSFKDLTINKKLEWLDNLLFIEADKKI